MRLWLTLLACVLAVWAVSACADEQSYEDPSAMASSSARTGTQRSSARAEDQGGVDRVEESAPTRVESRPRAAGDGVALADAGEPQGAAVKPTPASDAGSAPTRAHITDEAEEADEDAGVGPVQTDTEPPDSTMTVSEAPGADAGIDGSIGVGQGSCCEERSQPGCGDPALQACACALSPRCCSEAWDATCVQLVQEKHCQPGVRDCVCGSAEGQWQQAACCSEPGAWSDVCESVALNKCGASETCE